MPRFVVLIALVIAAACGQANDAPVYLDVRTVAEYADGHVRNAVNIPVEELEQRIGELAAYRDERVVVYCRTGRRSAIALELLRARGFTGAEDAGAIDRLIATGVTLE